jgi:hypothetical protein
MESARTPVRPRCTHAIMRRVDCLLCRIVAGTEAASVVYQDDRVLALCDLYPVNPGHLLQPALPRLGHPLIAGPRHLLAVTQEYVEHYNTRLHRSLGQHPPAGHTPPDSNATVQPLRRDRLGGLVHEYLQVA